jgi:hypothetical protein
MTGLPWLAYDPEGSDRILGKRAFGRDKELAVRSFQRLRQASNYVRNTHRQAATRAIKTDGGLGFATGIRFDLLALEPVGRALAKAFLEQPVGRGGTSLRNWLLGWLRGELVPSSSDSLRRALSPEHPTPEERELVRSRVLETSTTACEKRKRLAQAVGRAAQAPDVADEVVPRLRRARHTKQADEVTAACAFGAFLDRARDATATITSEVQAARGGIPLTTLARDKKCRKALTAFREQAKNFASKAKFAEVGESTSISFAGAISGAHDDPHLIRFLVGRVDEVLGLSGDSVIRGPLFRVIERTPPLDGMEEGAASIEPDVTGRTFRIANLHSLLRDVG